MKTQTLFCSPPRFQYLKGHRAYEMNEWVNGWIKERQHQEISYSSTIYLFLKAFLFSFIFHSFLFTCPIQAFPFCQLHKHFPKFFSIYLLFLIFWITVTVLTANSFCCFQSFQPHGFKPEEIRLIFLCGPQSHKSNFKFQNSPNIFEMLITL